MLMHDWISRRIGGHPVGLFSATSGSVNCTPPRPRSRKKTTMEEEVRRVYATLLTREVRRPRSDSGFKGGCLVFWRPRFFGTQNSIRIQRRLIVPNEGLHSMEYCSFTLWQGVVESGEVSTRTHPYVAGGCLERIDVTGSKRGMVSYA